MRRRPAWYGSRVVPRARYSRGSRRTATAHAIGADPRDDRAGVRPAGGRRRVVLHLGGIPGLRDAGAVARQREHERGELVEAVGAVAPVRDAELRVETGRLRCRSGWCRYFMKV
jgi:hypothetical protein